jgi:hypothetical protein
VISIDFDTLEVVTMQHEVAEEDEEGEGGGSDMLSIIYIYIYMKCVLLYIRILCSPSQRVYISHVIFH